MVDIKERQLKYRMKKVKEKYRDKPKLLIRKKREWGIHKSIVYEFDRERVSKKEKLIMSNTVVTISPDGDYDVASNMEILNQVFKELNATSTIPIKMEYFIQRGDRGGKNHIHFLTNLTMDYKIKLYRYANYFTACNVNIRPIYEVHELLAYLKRETSLKGVLTPDNT